ncbi:hypothetical protein ACOSQ4_002206 [Xanthoceras sorbifolium]
MASKSFGKSTMSIFGKNGGSRFDVLADEHCEDADLIGSKDHAKVKVKDVVKGHNVLAEISNILEKAPKAEAFFKVYNNFCSKALSKGTQSKNIASIVPSSTSGRGISLGDYKKWSKKDKGKNKLLQSNNGDSSTDNQDELEDSRVLQQLHQDIVASLTNNNADSQPKEPHEVQKIDIA